MTFMGYPLIENVEIDQNVGILQKTPSQKMSKKNTSDGSRNHVIAGGGSSLTLTVRLLELKNVKKARAESFAK